MTVGCKNPEREANKLFTEASGLLREASSIEVRDPYAAFAKRVESKKKLEQIVQSCPSSSVALEYSKGTGPKMTPHISETLCKETTILCKKTQLPLIAL